jgi:predicted extracellular nuclease
LAAALLIAAAGQPRALSNGLVVSQVYGGGGNSGATYTNDYVEIFNRSGSAISLNGLSLQYASATGTGNFGATTSQLVVLPNALVPGGGYFLVQLFGGATGAALPAADASGTINMSGTAGKVALVNGTSSLGCNGGSTICSQAQLDRIIDLVGYGGANFFEGAPAPALTSSTAAIRADGGCTETDNNSLDFTAGTPSPRNSSSPVQLCGSVGPATGVVINEVDSDTPEADAAEFVELYDGGTGNTLLNGLVVVFYNGSTDTSYAAFDLDGMTTNASGYFTLGNAGVSGVDLVFNGNTLQNGADAVALYAGNAADFPNGTAIGTTNLVDAVVYDTADADDPGLLALLNPGQPQVDENQDGSGATNSIQRCPNGSGGARNTAGYVAAAPTPDGTNQCPPPAVERTISEIQGTGDTSPFVGQGVIARGIVTALRFNNGFFLQTPDGQVDGDPATSEGIFVFTSSAPAVAVGDDVVVTGTVFEFVPSADPHQAPVTEIVNPSTTVQASGQLLPEPIVLTAADFDPAGGPLQLERYEGMRVGAGSSLTSIAPTDGSVDEDDAAGGNNGVFYAVFTGTPRPHRETGIEVLDAMPPPPCDENAVGPCAIPVFDANPERVRVDSDGQAGVFPGAVVSTGATLTISSGVLDYTFRTWTILPDPGALTVQSPGMSAQPAASRDATDYLVASFNMERFFDTTDEPGIDDAVLNPVAYQNRLAKASLIVRNYLRTPDILGVQEVENLGTLQDIAARIDADAAAAGETPPGYQAFLEEGNDIGGIDVGFLARNNVIVHSVTQWRKDETYTDPTDGSVDLLNDRPSLVLDATVHGPADRLPAHVVVVVNHLRSLNGIDDPAAGPRVRAKRKAQAESVAQLLLDLQGQYADVPVVSVGDYNAFDVNDGYVDVLGIISGNQAPPEQVVDWSTLGLDPQMVDAAAPSDYSYVFDGNAQSLDHILLSTDAAAAMRLFDHARIDADFPEALRGGAGPERLSDHDPEIAYFTFPADTTPPVFGATADVTVAASSSAGATVTYPLPTATDNLDTSVTVDCAPASGSFFSVGTTTVSCTATDDAGNQAQTSFLVTVTFTSPAGTMVGLGQINGSSRVTFAFLARRTEAGLEFGALELAAIRPRALPSVLITLGVDHVSFSGHTVQFSGSGAWNGRPGHTYQVIASDNGEPGAGRDTFSVVIRNAQGAVVFEQSGTLTLGNIQHFQP